MTATALHHELHAELTAARMLQAAFGTRPAAAYLRVRGWSMESALTLLA